MAFGAGNVTTNVGKNTYRLMGATLAASAVGTIGNVGSGANIELPSQAPTIDANTICLVNLTVAGVDKPFLVTQAAGVISVTNQDAANASGALDMRVINLHTIIR
jgi:hypothetical protein